MFAIAPTDNNWFKFLKSEGLNSFINFWTPTPWNVKGLQPGDRLYFIDENYIIRVSSKLSNVYYQRFHGQMIALPLNARDYPSKQALRTRETDHRI